MFKTTIRIAASILLCAGPAIAAAPPQAAGAPLTFSAALDLATSRNLDLEAARRQRAIREAQVRTARQWANPEVGFEVTQDSPHENLTFGLPIEIGGQRGKRIAVAKEALTLADLDVRAAMTGRCAATCARPSTALLAADERSRLADEVVGLAERVKAVAQARFEEGAAPRLDVLQADLGLARAQADARPRPFGARVGAGGPERAC